MRPDPDYVRRRIAETRAAQGLPAALPQGTLDAVARLYDAALRRVDYDRKRRAA